MCKGLGLVETSVSHSQEVVSQIQNVESSVLRTANHVEEMGDKFRSIEEMVTIITSIADLDLILLQLHLIQKPWLLVNLRQLLLPLFLGHYASQWHSSVR